VIRNNTDFSSSLECLGIIQVGESIGTTKVVQSTLKIYYKLQISYEKDISKTYFPIFALQGVLGGFGKLVKKTVIRLIINMSDRLKILINATRCY
jgi:hypothetical protein